MLPQPEWLRGHRVVMRVNSIQRSQTITWCFVVVVWWCVRSSFICLSAQRRRTGMTEWQARHGDHARRLRICDDWLLWYIYIYTYSLKTYRHWECFTRITLFFWNINLVTYFYLICCSYILLYVYISPLEWFNFSSIFILSSKYSNQPTIHTLFRHIFKDEIYKTGIFQ